MDNDPANNHQNKKRRSKKERDPKRDDERLKKDKRESSSSDKNGNSKSRSTTTLPSASAEDLTVDSIYDFYMDQLYPALASSLPLLAQRITRDSKHWLYSAGTGIVQFLLPKWEASSDDSSRSALGLLPQQLLHWKEHHQASMDRFPNPAEFMFRYFDTNHDGHISAAELLNMTEILQNAAAARDEFSWSTWFSREWPLMDWKIGVFVWRTFGGILIATALCSIIPGRMHGWSARLLRWPVLCLTYFLIGVELAVYTVIRLVIKAAEVVVARPKHRKLRRQMAAAHSYEEWYQYAAELDRSQKRDVWLGITDADDITSRSYNWGFVKELKADLIKARTKSDSLMALAVLQQCTRKNVGGVMSEDLFSYSNTGEPKRIVSEFVEQVAITIRWVTEEAMKVTTGEEGDDRFAKETYDERLQRKVRREKEKIWSSLLSATLQFLDSNNEKNHTNGGGNGDALSNGSGNDHHHADGVRSNLSAAESDRSLGSAGDWNSGAASLPAFHREEVLTFLKRARAAYGRTALCLSGGAMMGMYHFGHILGLLEAGMLPHIISGTSAGCVVAAIMCTRTDEELRRDLQPEMISPKLTCFERPWSERLKSLWKNGNMFSFDEWHDLMMWFTCGNMTFEEAYKKSGRVLCVTLSSTSKKAPPVLLNYLTAPNVTVASAVIASAAVPFFIPPVRLHFKDAKGNIRQQEETFFDGSIRQDIPVNGLAEMLNCQFFIVCQANPHIVPFFFGNKGHVGRPSRWSSGMQETSWRGGFLLTALEMYLKNHMRAKVRFLNELEAAVGFTSTMMTQEFVGSTTIVPDVSVWDYFKLFSDPKPNDLYHCFQRGSVAAYEHIAMIRLHYSVTDVLEECITQLESGNRIVAARRRTSFDPLKVAGAKKTKMKRTEPKKFSPVIIRSALRSDADESADASGTSPVDSNPTAGDSSLGDDYSREWIDLNNKNK